MTQLKFIKTIYYKAFYHNVKERLINSAYKTKTTVHACDNHIFFLDNVERPDNTFLCSVDASANLSSQQYKLFLEMYYKAATDKQKYQVDLLKQNFKDKDRFIYYEENQYIVEAIISSNKIDPFLMSLFSQTIYDADLYREANILKLTAFLLDKSKHNNLQSSRELWSFLEHIIVHNYNSYFLKECGIFTDLMKENYNDTNL